jgi:hypothetical protein
MSDYYGKTDVEFFAIEGPQEFITSCRYCEGTGKEPDCLAEDLSVLRWLPSPCTVCRGLGVLRLASPELPITHALCKGTGREIMRLNLIDQSHLPEEWRVCSTVCSPCTWCQGLGMLEISVPNVTRIRRVVQEST